MRAVLLLVPLAGAALLVAAEFSTLYEVRVLGAVPDGGSYGTGAHHGYALLPIAAAIVLMSLGAVLGGSRPAAIALWVLGLAALAVGLLVDRPATDETGLIGRTYDAAEAVAGPGLRLELAGGCLVLVGAALILFTPWARRRPSAGRRPASAP